MSEISEQPTSPDKIFYDAEQVGDEAQHRVFMAEIGAYASAYADRLNEDLAGTTGIVAELGAGSCGLSAHISKLPNVRKIVCADISSIRMGKMMELSVSVIGGDASKMEPRECDFNRRLPFEDESVDAILFDAALHHTRSMWGLLAECHRVLRPSGLLVAQRESYLSRYRAGTQLGRLLLSPEAAASVSENMYLKEQYEYYLTVSGFDIEFIPTSPSPLKKMLRVANGRLFTDGVLYCRRKSAAG